MVVIAGQEPEDVHGNSVAPGDLAGQARQVYANLGRALTAAGARPDQVAKLTIYLRGGLHIGLPAGHRASQGGAIRAPQARRHAHRRGAAGPARVPYRGRRDRGEVRTASCGNRRTSQTQGLIEPRPEPIRNALARHTSAADPASGLPDGLDGWRGSGPAAEPARAACSLEQNAVSPMEAAWVF